jgi:prevent-host-death family protein
MKTVSATEAKNQLGKLLGELGHGTNVIMIEHHGRPRAVLVSAGEWTTLAEAQDRLRRLEAMEQIRELAEKVRARNADLIAEEANAIADEIADEAMSRVVARARQR